LEDGVQRLIAMFLLAGAAPSAMVKDGKTPKPLPQRVNVVALRAIPAEGTYSWRGMGEGNGPVLCTAARCDHYYMPPADSAPSKDVIVRMLMPDQSIVVVECYAKEVLGANYALKFWYGDGTDVPIRRTCLAPAANAKFTAALDESRALLFLDDLNGDGGSKPAAEVYRIVGTLTPVAGSPAVRLSESASPTAAGANARKCFLTTVPLGAQIYVDGERVGTTPMQVSLPAGAAPHVFTIRKDGYYTVQQKVGADSEQTRFDFYLKPSN
jgi:hypothetical protein